MIDAPVRLRRAIYMEDVALVQRIIKANPKLLQNPDFGDKSNTSLHLAAQLGLTAIASFLLKSGHEAKEISRNVEWETPLMIAAKHGHVEIGRFIIETCQRCIPWTNKDGLDAVRLLYTLSPFFTNDTAARDCVPAPSIDASDPSSSLQSRLSCFASRSRQ